MPHYYNKKMYQVRQLNAYTQEYTWLCTLDDGMVCFTNTLLPYTFPSLETAQAAITALAEDDLEVVKA